MPHNVRESHELDKQNSNTNWPHAMQETVDSLLTYFTLMMKDISNIHVVTKTFMFILSLTLNMTYVIKPFMLLVVTSLTPTLLTANIPMLFTT
jgi:hypothetical protein